MIITQTACACLVASLESLSRRSRAEAMAVDPPRDSVSPIEQASIQVEAPLAAVADRLRANTPETPDAVDGDPRAPLTPSERRARAAALRALALSRGRRFAAAQAAFIEAARLDPALDLTRTPTFWRLERAAHEAAIAAYVETGRERDAAVLRAQVRSTFRPRPVRPRQPTPATP